MSTRAFYGFIKGDTVKGAYNHYDGYPEELGVSLKAQLASVNNMKKFHDAFRTLQVISNDDDPIPEVIANKLIAKGYISHTDVSKKNTAWYWALHRYQGSILPFIEWDKDCRYVLNGLCYTGYEWLYFIDLNTEELIVKRMVLSNKEDDAILLEEPSSYERFLERLHSTGRVYTIPLEQLRTLSDDQFVDQVYAACR